MQIGKVDSLTVTGRQHRPQAIKASLENFPGVEEPGMYTNGHSATWEALTALPQANTL